MTDVKAKKKGGNTVFIVALGITMVFVLLGMIIPKKFGAAMDVAFNFLVDHFSWVYLISMLIFVVFALGLAFSKYGNIKLGPDDSKPEHSTISWFAMLFGAGMGIGLVFWGVAEPMNHYIAFGATEDAAQRAMQKAFMHWSFHPWAGYAIVGMALAYFQFRKGKPGLISSIFIPLIGEERVNGPIGKAIDILAVFATVAGVATSLGQGALQINAGLNHLIPKIPNGFKVQLIIIVVITIIYTWTSVSGIDKGIKLLSDINMILAVVLLLGAFIIGPKMMMVNNFTNSLGLYINQFFQESLAINPFGENEWLGKWTIFYWAWWIAWGPFVGTFIARISKGRTIREFVLGVIVAPSVISMIWFAVFGSLGLNLEEGVILKAIEKTETALFVVFSEYKLGAILSVIAILLLCTFFITSANSATFVLSMFSSNGDLNPTSSKKILWGVVQALLAISLLMSGGLQALQTCSVVAAFPFAFIMIATCFSMLKALKTEKIAPKNTVLLPEVKVADNVVKS